MTASTSIFLCTCPSSSEPLFLWDRFPGVEQLLSNHRSHVTFPPALCENPILFTSPPAAGVRALTDVQLHHSARLTCVFLTANIHLTIFFIRLSAMSFVQSLAGQSRLCSFFYWDALSFQAMHELSSVCPSRTMLCLSPSVLCLAHCGVCTKLPVLSFWLGLANGRHYWGSWQEEREVGELTEALPPPLIGQDRSQAGEIPF